MDDDLYITVEETAARLRLSPRQASRYADKVRTRRSGKRTMYHADDVDALAQSMHVDYRPPPIPRAELAPASVMMDRMREQEDRIAHLSREVGRLEGVLAERERVQHVLTSDLQSQLNEAREELARLTRKPWWKRLLDR
jgi:hypothetical protein